MLKKTKTSFKPIAVILSVSAVIAFTFVFSQKPFRGVPVQVAEIAAGGTVSLEASPPPTHLVLNREYTLNINAHSGTSHVTAVQLELNYDPTKLSITNVAKTAYLPVYLEEPTTANGSLKTTVGVDPAGGGKSDWGTVVTLTIKPLVLGEITLEFGPGSLAATTESDGNSLGSVKNELMTVYNVGDINFSKKVDLFDYNLFVPEFGKTTYSVANLDGKTDADGKTVGLLDYNLFVTNYGAVSP